MQRITTETRQRDKFGPGKDGFTAGNIATGVSSTQLEPDWFDALQEEVSNVIEIELGPLNALDREQLWKAIDNQISRQISGIPVQPGFVLRAGDTMTGNLILPRVIATSGANPGIAMINTGTATAPAYGLTVGGDPGILSIGLVDNTGYPLGGGGLVRLESNGRMYLNQDPVNPLEVATKGYVDNRQIDLSGYLPLTGGTITGPLNVNGQLGAITTLYIGGAGVQYAAFSSNLIGFGWDGANVNSYVDAQYQGRVVTANPSAFISGNLDVGGNGNFASLGCFGNATINGSISTGYLGCHGGADIVGTLGVGWINSAGDFAITAGGAFSSNGGQIDICQTGTRGNVGLIRLAGNFVQSGGTHDVYGDLRVTGTIINPWGGFDEDAIGPYEHGLAEIRQLTPMIFGERRFVGLALDDCREAMPEMVSRTTDHAGVMTEGLNTGALSYALVNAIKELADRIEELEGSRPEPAPH
jgi:hypothetical protein